MVLILAGAAPESIEAMYRVIRAFSKKSEDIYFFISEIEIL
jgi:DNA-binding XRE family transcriptional regulator